MKRVTVQNSRTTAAEVEEAFLEDTEHPESV